MLIFNDHNINNNYNSYFSYFKASLCAFSLLGPCEVDICISIFWKIQKLRHLDFRYRTLVSDLGFLKLESFLFQLCCITPLRRMHLMNPERVHRKASVVVSRKWVWLYEGRIKNLTRARHNSQIRMKEIWMSLWIQRLREECAHVYHIKYMWPCSPNTQVLGLKALSETQRRWV